MGMTPPGSNLDNKQAIYINFLLKTIFFLKKNKYALQNT